MLPAPASVAAAAAESEETQTHAGDADGVPEEKLWKSCVYIWTHAATGVRYAVHVVESSGKNVGVPPRDMTSSELRDFTVVALQCLDDTSKPFVLVHYMQESTRIEVTIPEMGGEDEVRALSRAAEGGPHAFLGELVRHYQNDVARDGRIHVELVEVRYDHGSDLSDSSRHVVIHAKSAAVTPAPRSALHTFMTVLQSYGIGRS